MIKFGIKNILKGLMNNCESVMIEIVCIDEHHLNYTKNKKREVKRFTLIDNQNAKQILPVYLRNTREHNF